MTNALRTGDRHFYAETDEAYLQLYNVVVDTTDTGKDLLANGKLQKRVTLIPLDKVRRDEIDRRALQQAQQLVGKDHCRLAKNLIEYDKAVDAAMAHVFGRTLVCDDMDIPQLVKEAREKLEEYRVIARAQEEEVQKHLKNLDRLKKDTHTAGLRKNQLQGEIDDIRKTAVELEKRMKQLVKQFTWIEEEKKHFGKAGSSYDFGGTFNAKKARQELEDKKARKDDLSKKVNMKAMNMLTEAENQARKLEDQKSQLEKDKQQLMETIEQLDLKKKEEIIKAHEQVNRDFGSIFSSLLPGTSAKLDPPGGKSPLDGLEVRVAFRDQWKDSLGELSGGQRSLVALSLVLAMLKFKPAPIYILDEVDAALDLSHTQNIGSMIKSYFQESQFIIVSLKDGMFNHANVLFKTKFVDGTSTVTRTTNVHSDGRKGK
uniref:SMC hinge domain-containing protein n=1 Tax=Plectus sambesii TaxID=2011161 RepID=A0A914WK10_9BILA